MRKLVIVFLTFLLVLAASCTIDPAEAPTIDTPSGTVAPDTQVSITTSVKNGQIRYTLDGTDPTCESALYESSIRIVKNTILKAAVFKSKKMVSQVARAQYCVKANTPTAGPTSIVYYAIGQQVTLSCSTTGVSIYYTIDGTTPTELSTKYTEPITLEKNTTIKAIAASDDYSASDVCTVGYNVKAAAPTSDLNNGTYSYGQQVSLSCTTEGVSIYYTTDGTIPEESSTKYTGPITMTKHTTLKAIASSGDYSGSDCNTWEYSIKAATPTADVDAGTYAGGKQVTLSCATSDVSIYYTTDGTIPTSSSTKYTESITLTKNTTVKAIAIGSQNNDSAVLTVSYSIKAATPTADAAAGTYASGKQVSLSCGTPGVSIYYTTDGTIPTTSSTKYTEAITLTKNTTIKAIASSNDCITSDVFEVDYGIKATLFYYPESGTYSNGTLVYLASLMPDESLMPGVSVYYTTDGTTPTESSTKYTDPISLTKNTTLKAIAIGSQNVESDVVAVDYKVEAALPTASVPSGTVGTSLTITLSCATSGATMYYTLDGTRPSTSSMVYSNAITLTATLTPKVKYIKVIAVADDCETSETFFYYRLYIVGPAGGIVFYDCDADNNATNNGAGPDNLKSTDCGWRYLEASPEDIKIGNTDKFVFGYYRTSDSGSNLFVNGTTNYVRGTSSATDGKSTGTAIGTGKANTAKLVAAMGNAAYIEETGNCTTADYAAKLCDDYTYGGYSDWFLPSIDELSLMYSVFNNAFYTRSPSNYSASDYYWSSSEDDYQNGSHMPFLVLCHSDYRTYDGVWRYYTNRIRAIRSFMTL